MAKLTNYAAGPRGVTLKDGSTVWLEPGQSEDIKKDDIAGELPDLGRAPAAGDADDDLAAQVKALTGERDDLAAQVKALTARVAELEAAAGVEPGPLDQSIEKLTEYLDGVTDADEVQKLLDAEKSGKTRAGAIAALEARRDAILAS